MSLQHISGGFMSVEQKVKQIIVEQLGVDEAKWITTRVSSMTWAPIRSTSSSW